MNEMEDKESKSEDLHEKMKERRKERRAVKIKTLKK